MDLEKIKEFILWAKSQKITVVKIDSVEIAFSEMAFLNENLDRFDEDSESIVNEAEMKRLQKEAQKADLYSLEG